MENMPEALPCPCCGARKPYVGRMHAMGFGVKCMRCKLEISRDYPDRYPKGITSLEQLHERLQRQAIEAWNTRKGEK